MIKDIITDESLLKEVSEDIDLEIISPRSYIVENLLDTARHNKDRCLGLAANQIGINKRVMALRKNDDDFVIIMNPVIIAEHGGRKQLMEYCLSKVDKHGKLVGTRTKRYKKINVKFHVFDDEGKPKEVRAKYDGVAARTIRHEVDHFNGRLI